MENENNITESNQNSINSTSKKDNSIVKAIIISIVCFSLGFALFFVLTAVTTTLKWNEHYSQGFLISVLNIIRGLIPFILCIVIPPITFIRGLIKHNKNVAK